MAARGQFAAMQTQRKQPEFEAYSRSLRQFCNFVEYCSQEEGDAARIAAMCEAHAESVRLSAQDVTMESIDMLLNTMLNTLYNMSEAQEQKRLGTRVKNAIFGHERSQRSSQHSIAFQNM